MSNEQSYIGLDIESVSQISDIPADVDNLRIIHCNNLTTLKSIEKYKRLTNLDCSSNQISTLDGLDKLVLLKELNLSCNDIEYLVPFEKLTGLTKVNLSHNRIKSLKGFQKVHFSIGGG
jgi:Leucine-rich repeat (LRR) protein